MKYAIFDMDDTLCHFTKGFFNWMIYNDVSLKNIPYFYSNYHLLSPFKGRIQKDDDLTYWLEQFEASGQMNYFLRSTDLLSYFKLLLDSEYHIIVMTARGWMKNPYAITKQWLIDNNALGKNVSIFIVPLGVDKADEFAKSPLYDTGDEVIAIFDDVESHLMGFKRRFPYAARIAPARPWNADAPIGKWENIQRRENFGEG